MGTKSAESNHIKMLSVEKEYIVNAVNYAVSTGHECTQLDAYIANKYA